MPAYVRIGFLLRQFPFAHICGKKTCQFGHSDNMKLKHEVYTFHRGLAVWIEEENTCIVDKNINDKILFVTPCVQLLGCVRETEVREMCDCFYSVMLRQVGCNLLQFLFLIANQDKVTMIIPRQSSCILQSDTATCARY